MMRKGKKKYIPTPRYDPALQSRRVDKLSSELENHRKHIHAISFSHDNHINHLGNFARHDIKNSVQSMDSILYNINATDLDVTVVESLNVHLDTIRETLDNFTKLVPYSTSGKFSLNDLMIAVELLSRSQMNKYEVSIHYKYEKSVEKVIELPFQVILQMMNNLIINSIKALEESEEKEIEISSRLEDNFLYLTIKDNGKELTNVDKEKMFDYGYSTTGGSGIGLYHANFLCTKNFEGSISVDTNTDPPYNKAFFIQLPINVKDE